jgi:hypothetical protein
MSGAATAIGVGIGLEGVGATVVGSAIIGGGIAAVTGGNVVQGAVLGGVGGAISGAVSGFAGTGGAAGATLDAQGIIDAQNAYIQAGYTPTEAANFVSQATGVNPAALQNAIDTGGSITAGAQTPFATSGSSALSNAAGKAATSVLGQAGGAVGNLVGANLASNAAQDAAKQKEQAAATANQQQLAAYYNQMQIQAPWLQAGQTALGQLSAGTQPGGEFVKPFSATEDMGNVNKAMGFAKDQGLSAMKNQAAEGGQNLSSNTIQGVGTLAEGLASQYEGQAYNQFMGQRQQSVGELQSLANVGQTAAGVSTAATGASGGNTANLTLAAGNAGAQGTLGSAAAWNQGIGNVGQGLGNMLAQILTPSPGA